MWKKKKLKKRHWRSYEGHVKLAFLMMAVFTYICNNKLFHSRTNAKRNLLTRYLLSQTDNTTFLQVIAVAYDDHLHISQFKSAVHIINSQCRSLRVAHAFDRLLQLPNRKSLINNTSRQWTSVPTAATHRDSELVFQQQHFHSIDSWTGKIASPCNHYNKSPS